MKKLGIAESFGIDRVIKPVGTVPVTAWKLDASRELRPDEARIKLKYFQMERDNYQQIASSCNYEDNKMKAKIMDLVEKRGKLHNPFTNSGGVIYGTVEDMGEVYRQNTVLNIGDEFLGMTSSTALPMHVERIVEIDHNYAQIELEGYSIVFCNSLHYGGELEHIRYTMTSIDEEGTLYDVYSLAKPGMKILVIGKDLVSAAYYLSAVRKAVTRDCKLDLVFDYECIENYDFEEIKKVMKIWADSVTIVNLGEPIKAMEDLGDEIGNKKDLVINCEDIKGSEVLTVMMAKNNGTVFFTSITDRKSVV